jgi:hypothetical protein
LGGNIILLKKKKRLQSPRFYFFYFAPLQSVSNTPKIKQNEITTNIPLFKSILSYIVKGIDGHNHAPNRIFLMAMAKNKQQQREREYQHGVVKKKRDE